MIRFPWRKPKSLASAAPKVRALSYQCAGVQGVGCREQQEDAYAIVNAEDVTRIGTEGLLALVADGMGGMRSGAQASNHAIAVVAEDFRILNREEPLEPQLAGCIDHAGAYEYVLNSDSVEFGGNGFNDDSVMHYTNFDPLYAPQDKGWLSLYLPARTACVLHKIKE